MACRVNIKQINDKKHKGFSLRAQFQIRHNHLQSLCLPADSNLLYDVIMGPNGLKKKKIEASGFKGGSNAID